MALVDAACNDKKSCSNLDIRYIQMVQNKDVQKLKTEIVDVPNIKCAVDKNGWTMLHHAADRGHLKVVKYLVEEGTDLNARDKYDWTPLHLAAQQGHLTTVELLLNRGADLNSRQKIGWTPLHQAVKKGPLKVVDLLVNRGADLNARDVDGWTPLHFAVEGGHLTTIELLVNRGADLNARGICGWTPLHYAAHKGHLTVVELFANRGADLNVADEDGITPLVYGMKHINVASFLSNKMLNTLINQGKVDDAVKFYKEVLELQKESSEIVHPETLRKIGEMMYDQCQYSAALDILNDVPHSERNSLPSQFINLRLKCKLKLLVIENNIEYNDLQKICQAIFHIQYGNSGTNHCLTCQEAVSLMPDQNNIVKMVKENIIENEAFIENNLNNAFTQTKATECKKNFASLFFKKGKNIISSTMFFWLVFTSFVVILFFAFNNNINV